VSNGTSDCALRVAQYTTAVPLQRIDYPPYHVMSCRDTTWSIFLKTFLLIYAVFPLRKFYAEHIVVLLRIQLGNHADAQPMTRFKRWKAMRYVYDTTVSFECFKWPRIRLHCTNGLVVLRNLAVARLRGYTGYMHFFWKPNKILLYSNCYRFTRRHAEANSFQTTAQVKMHSWYILHEALVVKT